MPTNNVLEYSQKLGKKLDERFVYETVTGIFGADSEEFDFLDDKTIRISETYMSGLADYDRELGFVRGSIGSISRLYELAMERGRSFSNDRLTAKEALVKNALDMAKFQKEYVAPEVDAFNLSKLGYFATANGNLATETLTEGTAISKVLIAINTVQRLVGYQVPLVCFVSANTWGLMRTSSEYSRNIDLTDFKRGDITTKVRSLDEVPLIPVADNQLYSKYQYLNGADSGQENGGYVIASGAVAHNYLIVPRSYPKAITKTQKIRVFAPDNNIRADAWQMDYRRTYDLLCTAEKQKGIFASKLG